MSTSHDASNTGDWPDLAGRLIEMAGRRAHLLPVRVYFEDTDFSGLVYHASYIRWCERGRSDFLRLIGNDHRESPIRGLYAAGCDVGNVHHLGYMGGLATGLVTGRTAGLHAARRARR